MSCKTKHQRRVAKFMKLAGQEVPKTPTIPDAKTRELRAMLILEEALETVAALGFGACVHWEQHSDETPKHDITLDELAKPDIVEVVDGCCDISVVTMGTLLSFGVSDRKFLEEVDRSNMRKFGPGSYRREDGKWMKPPLWEAPDILTLLKEQGYNG